ncbi:dolichyl-diphosphooligosaccharide--protein glycosyltransferase [Halarchaeum rubridurum]|uniref:dolichyl-phosphooligosaccharide-protein glycotransferase n=1 Tax=Halarchaeum rubridurum TaxID=489911 RepID=A0A830FP45_9EURY|nr:oligosaccharyl transferase, archaeosortase A system-associated [Halarchaeum rubridurum]MBP1953345.1 dolichyl-diphosphooligosaccharide--protein glycosyltransferase [Halarchaeum rubridurum]GGM66048.1 oligosaccharyl transferase [Halarchaeum rubridurum]
MSDDTDRSAGPSSGGRSVLDIAADWYPVPVVALLMAFMLWVRGQSWQNFVRDGQVILSGNDPWYHLRSTMYVVQHWPATMPFDVWTEYPYGNSVDQFGTLFDQLMATVALILGAGSPSEHLVRLVVLFTPVVVGALVAIPTYYLGKRLAGRAAGVLSVAVLAFLPGLFLQRSLVGTADHNVAEPLFQASAVALLLVAFYVAERDRPVWEQVRAREWDALKPVLGWSTLAGVATALYMWVWPPGVLLVGIVGVFFLLKLASVHLNGGSPDHLSITGATSMGVTGVLLLLPFDTVGFAATRYSLLQVVGAFGVAAACVFLAWLSRTFEARDVDRRGYPLAVLGITVVGVGVVALVLPDVFSSLFSNFTRFIGFGGTGTQRTIGEAQPWLGSLSNYGGSRFALFFSQYGLAFFAMLAGLGWLLWRPFVEASSRKRWFAVVAFVVTAVVSLLPGLLPTIAGNLGLNPTWTGIVVVGGLLFASVVIGDHDAEKAFVVVWTLFLIAAAFTQVRFNYYLAVPVAVLSGYAGATLLRSDYVNIGAVRDSVDDVEAIHVIAVVAVLLILIAPLAASVTLTTDRGNFQTTTAVQTGASAGPGGVTGWAPMLDWMEDNTPAEGNYGGAGNADQLDYYGTYHQTDDYDYPEGSYGVMSWWDYGHWITVLGERIPNANPFQGGATYAANYLLAQNETHANEILDSKGDADEKTRYVAVDWQMAAVNSKFSAPTVFYDDREGVSQYDYYRPLLRQTQNGGYQLQAYVHTQNYYETMMVRLFRYQGSAMSPEPIVVDWDNSQGPYYLSSSQGTVQQFNTTAEAEAYVANDSTSQIGGVGRYPSEYVPALEHYRLVGLSTEAPSQQLSNMPAWAKLYERVPGATVQGSGPANATVTASVTMYSTQQGKSQNFTYTQRAQTGPNGEFTMTLPYSTTGYDEYGPENGYTNVSVRSTGSYSFSASANGTYWTGSANVTEGQVNGVNDTATQVTMSELDLASLLSGGSGSSSGSDTSSSSDGTSGSGTSDGSSGSTSDTAASVTTPTTTARAA